MSKPIFVIGAGDSSREFRELIPDKQFAGFIDDFLTGEDIYGSIDYLDMKDCLDNDFVVAIGNPQVKKKIVEERLKVNYATLIHPKSIISLTAKLGEGQIIMAGAIISRKAVIHDHVIIHYNAVVGHNSTVGKYCNINPGVQISGNVTIGEGVYVGANATILPTLKIGDNAQISAGAVVHKDVPEGVIVGGNPARIISKV